MSLSRYILTALLTALVSIPVAAADWTQFRGPGGLGVSTEKGLPTTWSGSENIVWKTDLPGAGTSSPIFVGDKIFLTCYSGYNEPGQRGGDQADLKRQVVCLNRKDGKLVWAKEVPSKLPEQERIRDDHGYASSTPVSDGKTVFAFFGKSGVFAFDLTGKQLWQADVGDELNGWGSAASPVLFENLVIVNASVESDSLIALDKATGKEVWRARSINEAWNTPILLPGAGGKTELIVSIPGKVQAHDPKTGTVIWSCDSDNRTYMVPSVVAQGGIIYSHRRTAKQRRRRQSGWEGGRDRHPPPVDWSKGLERLVTHFSQRASLLGPRIAGHSLLCRRQDRRHRL